MSTSKHHLPTDVDRKPTLVERKSTRSLGVDGDFIKWRPERKPRQKKKVSLLTFSWDEKDP